MTDQPNSGTPYDKRFFASIGAGSDASARRVLPLAMEVQPCRSVIDVGCGTGAWLAAAAELGVSDIVGVDGAYVRIEQLAIPSSRFIAADLSNLSSAALRGHGVVGERRFDMAMSLEVAEHLPESSAAGFVALLASLSDVVLFSAAIPFQGGTGHLNEQFPSWWAKLFGESGYVPVDVVRDRVWDDPLVEWWYRQNMVLFVAAGHPAASRRCRPEALDRVHPRHYQRIVKWAIDCQIGGGLPWVSQEQSLRARWPS